MDKSYEAFVRLNSNFDKALMDLHECHAREVRELRGFYIKALRRVRKLEVEIKILKGENNVGK